MNDQNAASTNAISTADLCDQYPDELRVLDPIFNNYGGVDAFFGEVVTIRCFEDNSKVKELAATAGEGRVMIVDGGGSLRRALLGDMIAENAVNNGWAGLVINGCIRDSDAIAGLQLGVKALNTIPVKTDKRGLGDVDVPVTFAGHTIQSGDWVYSDNDGIVLATRELSLT